MDADGDHTQNTHRWDMFLMGGDPARPTDKAFYRSPVSDAGWLSCPDNITFDKQGRIWIATDGQEKSIGKADGLYAADCAGAATGMTRHFFRAPRGAEVCGPSFTPDGTTLFLAVQHPGDTKGATFDKPSTSWPDFNGGAARPAIIAITRDDGGVVGT